ncbi:MAG: hypothetical protein J6Y37_00540 [Paludibacteraceae bacterium]|nr:hypothetical protein [Paludibacteraceae bacterium]
MKNYFYAALALLSLSACQGKQSKTESAEEVSAADSVATEQVQSAEEVAPAEPAKPTLAEQMANMKPLVVESPESFAGLRSMNEGSGFVKLKVLSCKENAITDTDSWIAEHQAGMPYQSSWQGDLKEGENTPFHRFLAMPETYDGLYRGDFEIHSGYNVVAYGANKFKNQIGYDCNVLVVTDSDFTEIKHIVDFRSFTSDYLETYGLNDNYSPTYSGYTVVGDSLYVVMAHRTYSKGSKGMNAYLMSINMKGGYTNWMTKPLTCNSQFIIMGNSIVCGYGFSGEPHNLYVVDRVSGERVQTIPVKKTPELFSLDGDKLYMRTYSYDYVLGVTK